MKQLTFFKSFFLLCALIVGSNSVWATEATITKTMTEIATANNWTTASGSGTQPCYTSFDLDANITISTSGGANCGSFWGTDWRLYQAQSGDVTVTAKNGCTLKSVTFTYTGSNNGVLKDGSTNVSSGSAQSLTGTTKTYTVGRTGTSTSTNGQVRMTQISVTYEVAAPAYTITPQSNNTEWGTVSLSGSVITATPKEGYRVSTSTPYSISPANSATVTQDGNTFTVTPSEDCTVSINFEAIPTYAIKWSVNGTVVQTDNVEENTAIAFPTSITGIPDGYVLKGWVTETNKISGTQATAPTYVTEATSTENITYYAVMAVEVGAPASLTKLTKDDDIADGDKIVFVAVVDENTAYGMYQQTQSSSYVANFNFTESVSAIATDSKKWFTMEKSNSNWKIGDDTNGYLYSSSSTNLAVSTDNSTKFVLEKGNDGTFQFSYTNGGTKRYLCCRTDLTSDKANLFRLSSSDGVNKLTLYRYTEASIANTNFCTTVPTATVTIAAACNDGKGVYYGTYSNGSAFVVPAAADMTVSAVSVDGQGKLVVTPFDEGDIVKAGTGVMVSSTAFGNHTITLAAGGADIDGNMLKGSGDAAISASDMSTAAPGCKYYRLTMHNASINPPGVIGFYWGAASGVAFDIAANKAYLAVSEDQVLTAREGFTFGDTATGINGVEEIAPVTKTRKVVKNGRLVIETANGEFTIDGARMK